MEELKETLVKRYIPLAKHLAYRYRNVDDALGIAFLKLVECVNKYPDHPNLGGYICVSIYKELTKEYKRWRRTPIKISHNVHNTKINFHVEQNIEISVTHDFSYDLTELIETKFDDPIEKLIITKTLEGGYTLKDIADESQVSISKVWEMREKVFAKLEKLLCQ
jgi:RNA polymerase sigma factor (sigma-70 family)